MRISGNSKLVCEIGGEAVRRALAALERDKNKVFTASAAPGAPIRMVEAREDMAPECFCLQAEDGALTLRARDERGFVYGIYEVSRRFLGVDDFWFWNDAAPCQRDSVRIPKGFRYASAPSPIRWRGWFINDEVLLHAWRPGGSKEQPWEMAFEALLRCRGNMVIPGTGENARRYRALAAGMGLAIAHHHAEPLGAEMFARAYPGLSPSYSAHPEEFEQLWRAGMEEQRGMQVVWGLGFRGQGDRPFWEDDPRCTTLQARGELLGRLIRRQYALVQALRPGAPCAVSLYGEAMELYRDGLLRLPAEVIKIWADNGYGRMVSRRQGNHNPRVRALPAPGDGGRHGVYYHVSFYDLQAANHITMLQNPPEFVVRELEKALAHGMGEYWLINCSNIKPHVYFLDLIAHFWRQGSVDVEGHRRAYARRYYGAGAAGVVAGCLSEYPRRAPAFGPHVDEHAGEQFANHVARILVSQYRRDRGSAAQELRWATGAGTLAGQVRWYRGICAPASAGYAAYRARCQRAADSLGGAARELFCDSLLLQARVLHHSYAGALATCQSLLLALEGEYQRAFFEAGLARREYLRGNAALRGREHGKWKGFYQNECLTDLKQSAWVLAGLMSDLRNLGEGPHFYQWQREFLYPPGEREVLLVLNMENHLPDGALFALMLERWEKERGTRDENDV